MSIETEIATIAAAADKAATMARVDEIATAVLIGGLQVMHADESLVMLTSALARVAEHILATCVTGGEAARAVVRQNFLDITARLTAEPCRSLIGGGA